jgi:hypothetical protein
MWDEPINGTIISKSRGDSEMIKKISELDDSSLCKLMSLFLEWEDTGKVDSLYWWIHRNLEPLDPSYFTAFDRLMEWFSIVEMVLAKRWLLLENKKGHN